MLAIGRLLVARPGVELESLRGSSQHAVVVALRGQQALPDFFPRCVCTHGSIHYSVTSVTMR